LLKEFDGRDGRNLPDAKSGDAPTFSQREAAEQAGLSKDQQVQAVRAANVPRDDYSERKAGAFLARMEKSRGAARTRLQSATALTYDDLGIEKTQAFRWQEEAAICR
jgi:hypothetical protein